MLVNFQIYKVTVLKTVWYWCQDRQIAPWGRTENPKIDSHIYVVN